MRIKAGIVRWQVGEAGLALFGVAWFRENRVKSWKIFKISQEEWLRTEMEQWMWAVPRGFPVGLGSPPTLPHPFTPCHFGCEVTFRINPAGRAPAGADPHSGRAAPAPCSLRFPRTGERVCPDPWQRTVGVWPGWREGAVWDDRWWLCWAAGKFTAPRASPTVPGRWGPGG